MIKYIYKILITVCLTTITNYLYSQNFEYGIKVGLPISCIGYSNRLNTHIHTDKTYDWMHYFKPRIGLNIGLIGRYNISSKISLRIEPGYILKGANFSSSSAKLDLHYWHLPIIGEYKISDNIGIYIGSEFSKLIKANLGSINLDSFYNEMIETSILMGAERNISKNVGIGVRVNYGLTKVSETKWMDEEGIVYGTVKENNYYTLLYAVYTF